jgi:hypothetical protein
MIDVVYLGEKFDKISRLSRNISRKLDVFPSMVHVEIVAKIVLKWIRKHALRFFLVFSVNSVLN